MHFLAHSDTGKDLCYRAKQCKQSNSKADRDHYNHIVIEFVNLLVFVTVGPQLQKVAATKLQRDDTCKNRVVQDEYRRSSRKLHVPFIRGP